MQEESKVKKSFHQNMKAELKKVIWPTGKQVVKSTGATIGFVLLISVTLIILNFVFSFLNEKWIDLVSGNNTNPGVVSSGDNESDDTSGDIMDEYTSSGDASGDITNESGEGENINEGQDGEAVQDSNANNGGDENITE